MMSEMPEPMKRPCLPCRFWEGGVFRRYLGTPTTCYLHTTTTRESCEGENAMDGEVRKC
jgi:hypothetical protein